MKIIFTIATSALLLAGCFEHRQPKAVQENKKSPNSSPTKSYQDDSTYGGDNYGSNGSNSDDNNTDATQVPTLPYPTNTPTNPNPNPNANSTATPTPTGASNPQAGTVQMSFSLVSDSTTPWQDRVKIAWVTADGVKVQPQPEYKLTFKVEKVTKNSVNFTPAIDVTFTQDGHPNPCHVTAAAITEQPKTVNAVCQ